MHGGACGNDVYDAHIAATCVEHGVTQILTEDPGFPALPGLEIVRLDDVAP